MRLSEIRRRKGVKTTEIAARLGISQGYYSNLERGKRPFTESLLRKAAGILEVPLNTLRQAVKSQEAESVKLKSWLSDIKINGLPLIKAFKYHIEANGLQRSIHNDSALKAKLKEYIQENIGFSVLAELSENTILIEEIRNKFAIDDKRNN
jgi:transcriptional regulator with XRE-family HTH domain